MPSIDWLNLSHGSGSSREDIFISSCLSNGLFQLIQEPTRPASGKILDLLLVSNPEIIQNLNIEKSPVCSDHNAICFDMIINDYHPIPSDYRHDFLRSDFVALEANLSLVDWISFFSACKSSDEMYTHFVSYLNFLNSIFTPVFKERDYFKGLHKHIAKLKLS